MYGDAEGVVGDLLKDINFKPKHMPDNVQARLERLPNEKERQKIVAYLQSL
jgi:hypothetical protein